MRLNTAWKIWYCLYKESNAWGTGVATLLSLGKGETFVRWCQGSPHFLQAYEELTPAQYESSLETAFGLRERDPTIKLETNADAADPTPPLPIPVVPDSIEDTTDLEVPSAPAPARKFTRTSSPTRAAMQADAFEVAKKQGDVRIKTKSRNIKAALQVGDVVRVHVAHKLKHKFGDKNVLGIVHEVLPKRAYHILTHAGILSRKIGRDELILEKNMTAAQLQISPDVAKLPPLSEKDALSVISPHRRKDVICKCHKVSTINVLAACLHVANPNLLLSDKAWELQPGAPEMSLPYCGCAVFIQVPQFQTATPVVRITFC
jgi:hypothetical protein